MLEMILDKQIFFVLMGIFTVLGLAGKWVANASLKRLVRAAGSMGKSAHPLMRLVRAKFFPRARLYDQRAGGERGGLCGQVSLRV